MNNVILIGMPASGKSSVGVILAKTIGYRFIDTDILIQDREGKLLEEIIRHRGMEEFLYIEEACVTDLAPEGAVIATGGSVVYSEKAMSRLKGMGTVIYLKTDLAEIEHRIRNMSARGVVIRPGQNLGDIYAERIPLYSQYADKVIECDHREIEDIVTEISNVI